MIVSAHFQSIRVCFLSNNSRFKPRETEMSRSVQLQEAFLEIRCLNVSSFIPLKSVCPWRLHMSFWRDGGRERDRSLPSVCVCVCVCVCGWESRAKSPACHSVESATWNTVYNSKHTHTHTVTHTKTQSHTLESLLLQLTLRSIFTPGTLFWFIDY